MSSVLEIPNVDINDLEEFLREIEKLFDNIVRHWNQVLFREEDREPIADAWDELRPTFGSLGDQVGYKTAEDFEIVGLAGQQLKLKLKGLQDSWRRFFTSGTVRLLKELLDWINSILESLGKIIPGVDAVKEFKDALEKLIQYS
jgi:hypothetical protein